VPILFRCPTCDKRLSIAKRKAGTQTFCPYCRAAVAVPVDDTPPTELPELAPSNTLAPASSIPGDDPFAHRETTSWIRLGAVGGLVAFLSISLFLAAALLKPAHPREVAHNDDPPAPVFRPNIGLDDKAPAVPQSNRTPDQAHIVAQQPGSIQETVVPIQSPPPPNQPVQDVKPQTPSIAVAQAPPPRPIVPAQPSIPPVRKYDQFGNPIGPDVGLSRDGQFKGKKLLFWSGYENTGKVFFGPTNPLWKAWERQGFTVIVKFGVFRTEWLSDIDQLWILSTGRFELPLGVPAEAVVAAVDFLPVSEIPSGFTAAEYKFIVQATLDMSLSRVHPLNEQAYRAIEKFVQSGKGLCLLSDDDPFVVESNELAKRLYGVAVKGNYIADKIAYVRERKLTAAEIRKFKGVNFLYEGITISNVGISDKLEVALKASDGQPLIAVSKIPGQRVVIDCAFTQFCHGPTERTSYILKSAGAVRLAQNIAAYLAGKDGGK
jgi:hypothetical protein